MQSHQLLFSSLFISCFFLMYLIPNIERLHRTPLLHNLSHEFMAADKVGRTLQVAAVEVQVGAAERGRGDAEDGVGVLLDLRVRAIFDGDLLPSIPKTVRKGYAAGVGIRCNRP